MGQPFLIPKEIINFFLLLIHESFRYPNDGNIVLSKWQSANLVVKTSYIDGLRILIIDNELYPTYIVTSRPEGRHVTMAACL